jgi:hypothetical protein
MSDTIRARQRMIALKIETTKGVDAIAGAPAAADWVTCGFSLRFPQDATPQQWDNAAYEDAPMIPGGMRCEITITRQMAGSGAPGTAPSWGRLLQACRMEEVIQSTAVGAPTAATAGSATTYSHSGAPFTNVAQAYRGMAVLLTGNPSAGSTDVILDYTAARVATLAKTYSPVLDTSTLVQIPIQTLYRPTSDETVEESLTCYAYVDGLRHRIVGCSGTWGVGLRAGAPALLTVRLTGIVVAYNEATALPTNYTPITRQAPRWAGGVARFNRTLARCASLGFEMGVRTYYPENPEAAEGYDPPIITGAGPRFTIDPASNTTDTVTRTSAFRAGTPVPLATTWGSVAGNRFALSTPSAQVVDLQPAERAELGVDAIALMPDGPNASAFLSCW